jgi:amino acid transporter
MGILGIAYGGSAGDVTSTAEGHGSVGTAMIFVLLTYGGWNEGVYLSAELSNVHEEMTRALLFGLLTITVVYVLVNAAYLNVLGLEGLRTNDTIGVELTERIFGTASSNLMAVFVVIAALSTMNASILTGARTNYALGRDFDLFAFLGEWDAPRNTPGNALLFQGAIALALVGLGTITQEAVATMVDYTAPVFWFFIFLTTASLFVFRWRGTVDSAYRVPLYPVTPILFLLAAGYLLYSSVMFTGTGALVGIAILVLGGPIYYVSERWW